MFAKYTSLKARSLPAPANANFITNVPDWTASFRFASTFNLAGGRLDLLVEVSIIGPKSITTDKLSQGSTYNRLSAKPSYKPLSAKCVTIFTGLVAFNKPLQKPRFDFGNGVLGVSSRPRFALKYQRAPMTSQDSPSRTELLPVRDAHPGVRSLTYKERPLEIRVNSMCFS